MSIDQVLRTELTPEQYNAAIDPAKEVLCSAQPQNLTNHGALPPELYLPGQREMVRAFSLLQGSDHA